MNAETIPRLRCRAVVGAANNQLDDAGGRREASGPRDSVRARLRRERRRRHRDHRAGVPRLERRSGRPQEVLNIGKTLERVFAMSETLGVSTDAAARRLAEERLAAGR